MSKRSKTQTTLSISLPRTLREAMDRYAAAEHRSISGYIAHHIEAVIAREHPGEYGLKIIQNGDNNHAHIVPPKRAKKS